MNAHDRAVDHLRAQLDNHSTDETLIDAGIQLDGLARLRTALEAIEASPCPAAGGAESV